MAKHKDDGSLNDHFDDKLSLMDNINNTIGEAQGEGKTPTLELTEDDFNGLRNDPAFAELAEFETDKDGNQKLNENGVPTIKSYRGFPVKIVDEDDKTAA